jgi:nucleotide-binding universal stress UspA family protein
MKQPIIAAVDPRREDVAPAALGTLFARLLRAPLVLAAAYPVDVPIGSLYPEYARSIEHETGWALERVAERVRDPSVALRTTTLPAGDSPARALHDLAGREGAQLLVIGSSVRGTVGRAAPSAVTDRLLHAAPCPVAVAPAGYSGTDAGRPRVIGVAFTETPDARAALEYAGAMALAADARVRVLSVVEPPEPVIAGALDAVALEYVQRAREESARAAVEHALDELSADLGDAGESLYGRAPEALAAASRDLDLLVCGSRGYGPLRTVLLGGTSHELVRKAACPVVVVPRRAGDAGDPRAATDEILEVRR